MCTDKNKYSEEDILETIVKVYAHMAYWYYKEYNVLLQKDCIYDVEDFESFVRPVFEVEDIDWLYKELLYFEMGYFTYRGDK
ncbi:TPA: hypothetical protein ACF1RY_002975 [Enterococcus hirae]|uniref:hypothetical protein n=1 Tax=Enterococcus hirae TaxID=1354 RepID=UPI000DEA81E0|nr:hypothetical protein [Enterococcus hirae]RBT50354.1 hypothetical protein EA74_02293 [Enterococcus hirae]RBT68735.1 hypothetical protein EA82_01410 [Enterococcus hirae]